MFQMHSRSQIGQFEIMYINGITLVYVSATPGNLLAVEMVD